MSAVSTSSAAHTTNSSSPAVHSEDRRPLAICVRNLPARSSGKYKSTLLDIYIYIYFFKFNYQVSELNIPKIKSTYFMWFRVPFVINVKRIMEDT